MNEVYCASTKIILSWIFYYYWTPRNIHIRKILSTQDDHILLFKGVTQFWLRKQKGKIQRPTQQMCFINIPFNKKKEKREEMCKLRHAETKNKYWLMSIQFIFISWLFLRRRRRLLEWNETTERCKCTFGKDIELMLLPSTDLQDQK